MAKLLALSRNFLGKEVRCRLIKEAEVMVEGVDPTPQMAIKVDMGPITTTTSHSGPTRHLPLRPQVLLRRHLIRLLIRSRVK